MLATGKSRSKIQVLMALPGFPDLGQGRTSRNSQSSSILFRRGSHSNKRSLGTVCRTFAKKLSYSSSFSGTHVVEGGFHASYCLRWFLGNWLGRTDSSRGYLRVRAWDES